MCIKILNKIRIMCCFYSIDDDYENYIKPVNYRELYKKM